MCTPSKRNMIFFFQKLHLPIHTVNCLEMTLGCKWFITRSDLYQLLKWSWCFCKWLIIFFNGKSWSFESEKLIAADSLDSLTLKNTLQYNLIRSNFPCISHAFVLVGCWLFFLFLFFSPWKVRKAPDIYWKFHTSVLASDFS